MWRVQFVEMAVKGHASEKRVGTTDLEELRKNNTICVWAGI